MGSFDLSFDDVAVGIFCLFFFQRVFLGLFVCFGVFCYLFS